MTNLQNKESQDKFFENLHNHNSYNEIFGVNNYLENETGKQLDNKGDVNELIRARVLELKQKYFLNERAIKTNSFRVEVLWMTLVVSSLATALVASYAQKRISVNVLFGLMMTLFVLFGIFTWMVAYAHTERRRQSYDQFYFHPEDKSDDVEVEGP